MVIVLEYTLCKVILNKGFPSSLINNYDYLI